MATENREMPGPFSGLSNFRSGWLEDRLRVGMVAARVLDAVPDVMALPRSLTDRLLNSAGATAIVYRREGQSQLIELQSAPLPREAVTIDMRFNDPITLIAGALDTLFFGGDRTLRIIGAGDGDNESLVEVLMPEAPLRSDLLAYSRNIFILSLIVAVMTAAALYLIVRNILIAPIRRLTASRRAPGRPSRRETPGPRTASPHPASARRRAPGRTSCRRKAAFLPRTAIRRAPATVPASG